MSKNWQQHRNRIIGFGDNSLKKSYYPELQENIKELQKAQQNFETIFNNTSDGIIIHTIDGLILALNNAAKKLICSSSVNSIMKIIELPNNQDLAVIFQQIEPDKNIILEAALLTFNQTSIPVELSINETVWNNEKAIATSFKDLSERKKYEQQLIEAKNKAEEADRLKSEFLASMSHEIRTPMNAIVGFTEIIANQNENPDLENYANIVQDQTFNLLNLLDDIIDYAKIESSKIEFRNENFDLNDLLQQTVKFYFNKVSDKCVLETSCSKQIMKINCDKHRIGQLFSNLVSNSLKFTKEGVIQIGYDQVDENKIRCFVKDTGIGISHENQLRIFDRFTKVNNFSQGTGLGLSIVNRIIQAFNSKIWVESELNTGTTFYFYIPINNHL